MFYVDYHSHSQFSSDAPTNMRELALFAAKHGVNQMCITDHIDDCCREDPEPKLRGSVCRWADEVREFETVKGELEGIIDLRLGMELSGYNHMPDLALKIAATPGADFILASLHNTRETLDFYYYKFTSQEECERLAEEYLLENLEIAKIGGFDCMAHIGYFNKCTSRVGFIVPLMNYADILEEIFKELVSKGLGLEINTSGLVRSNLGESIPNLEALKLYRSLGGEVITIGSDTHGCYPYIDGLKKGHEILKQAGFKYVTTFKNRRPEFIKVD